MKLKRILLAAFVLIFSVIAISFIKTPNVDADTSPALTITGSVNNKGHISPHSYGQVEVQIKSNYTLSGKAIVSYKTVDKTAVAKAGDYTSTSGTVTIDSINHTAYIYISVKRMNYAVGLDSTDNYSNYFSFEITNVEGDYTIDDFDKTKIDCDTQYSNLFKYQTNSNGLYELSVYKEVISGTVTHSKTDIFHQITQDYSDNLWPDNSRFDSVIAYGLADEYFGSRLKSFKETSASSADIHLESYYYADGDWQCLQYIVVKSLDDGDDTPWSDIINKSGTVKDFVSNSVAYNINGMYLSKIPSKANKRDRMLGLNNKRAANADRPCVVEWFDTVYDSKAPEVKDVYATTFFEEKGGKRTEKLRVSVRFGEPVIVKNTNVKIKCSLGTGGSELFSLDYAEGSFTNTLCFETDLSNVAQTVTSNKLYDTLALKEIDNYSNIVDFSISNNSCKEYKKTIYATGISVDLRTPSVSATPDKNIAKSRIVNLSVELCKGGTLYYKWVKKGDHLNNPNSESSYEKKVPFSSTGATVIQTSRFEADGEYFLYVLAVATNGRKDMRIFGRDGTTTEADQKNGFLFDNVSPTVVTTLKRKHSGMDFESNRVEVEFLNDEDVKILVTDRNDSQILNASYKYQIASDGNITLSGKIGTGSYDFSLKYVDNVLYFTTNSRSADLTSNCFEDDGLKEKLLSFDIIDESVNGVISGLNKIILDYQNIRTKEKGSVILWDSSNLNSGNTYVDKKTGVLTKYVTDGLECEANTVARIPAIAFGIGDNDYGEFKCSVSVFDGAGNETKREINLGSVVRFDTRIRLETFSVNTSKDEVPFAINGKVYDITDGFKITFDSGFASTPSVNGLHFGYLAVDNVVYSFLDENGNYSVEKETEVLNSLKDYFNVEFISNGGTQPTKIDVEVKKACYMSCSFVFDKEQKTDYYDYYFTEGFNDETENYKSYNDTNLLNNKVYFLNGDNPFYYLDNISYSIKKLKYNDTLFNVAFSSKSTAFNYLRFYELQDLSILYITDDDLANKLNFSSDDRYLKDDTCKTKVAKRGDYWIKYKSSTWGLNQATKTSYWRYYYYGSDILHSQLDEILIEECTALNDAINAVCTLLANQGFENSYLVGDDYTVNGVPHLDASQMINKDLQATSTMNGDAFKTPISFGQDTAIYSSYITKEVKGVATEVKLVPSWDITLNDHTKVLYHPYDGLTEPALNEYMEYTGGGKTFQKSLPADIGSSLYIIYEFNDFGAHKYLIYIDNDAPVLQVGALIDGQQIVDTYDFSSTGTTIGAKNFSLRAINDNSDEYSYVALYRKTALGRTYLGTYRVKDVLDGAVFLEDNTYSLVIGDRSGNIFEMSLYINREDLIVEGLSEKEVAANKDYLEIKCNRTSDQIKRFEVYRGNTLLTNEYAQVVRFNETGYYTVIIEDIYNNTARFDNVHFERVLPLVKIKYYTDGGFVFFDPEKATEDSPLQVVPVGSGTYSIKTSVRIQFTFDQRLDFEVVSGNFQGRINQALGSYYLTAENLDEWTIRIFYADYPEVGITYMCLVDEIAPTIDVSYENQSYMDGFLDELNDKAIAAAKNGVELIPSTILFKEKTDSHGNKLTNVIYVYDNAIIGTEKFKFSVKDANGIRKVEFLKLNEEGKYEPVKEYCFENTESNPTFNVENIEVTEFGEFKIIATDLFGNKSSFTLINKDVSYYQKLVDDKASSDATPKTPGSDIFNATYGNQSDFLKVSTKGIVQYLITKNGEKHFYMFYVTMDGISRAHYQSYMEFDEAGNPIRDAKINYEMVLDDPFFDPTKDYKKGEWNLIPDIEIPIEYMCDGESFYFRIISDGTKTNIENTIVLYDNTIYHHFVSELSKEVTDVILRDISTHEEIKTNKDGELILINNGFFVNFDEVSYEVERIRIAYSKSLQFSSYSTIYKTGSDPIYDYPTNRDGFYSIRIINVYGNTLEYTISKQNSLAVTSEVTYKDGSKNGYSSDYSQAIYSNKEIKYTVISESCVALITKGGMEYRKYTHEGQDAFTFTILGDGAYEILITDLYGNEIHRTCEIKEEDLEFDERLLYGYNQKALGKADGYTNKKLSVDYSLMMQTGVSYLAMEYAGELYILYDVVSEHNIPVQDSRMLGIFGSLGNGTYKVIVRDRYGNNAIKEIHYSDTPTLTIEKNSRSDIAFVNVLPSIYQKEGVWSNNAISLESTSNNYIFKIDGNDSICPVRFNFSSDIGYGRFEYEIYYLDEYGFEYEFSCHLLRETIEIEIPSTVVTRTIAGVITTRNDITLSFNNSLSCKYMIDGDTKEYEYLNGSTLYADGTYRFTVYDKAGNSQTLTLYKDSACYFTFVEQRTGANLISGQIANSNRIIFNSNSDSAKLTKVYRNGSLVKEDLGGVFTEDGKYDCLISDEIGNMAFFTFYIITKEMSKFDYRIPYDYIITSMWLKKPTGERYAVIDLVDVKEGFSVSPDSVIKDDGIYEVEIQSIITSKTITFKFTIDNTPPDVRLDGCMEGETTLNTVTLKNYNIGDKIEVYRNGKLSKTVNVTSATDAPTFTDGGVYKILITNTAGVSQVLEFTKTRIANTAGSVLIIILIVIVIVALFIGLLLRNRSRVDK